MNTRSLTPFLVAPLAIVLFSIVHSVFDGALSAPVDAFFTLISEILAFMGHVLGVAWSFTEPFVNIAAAACVGFIVRKMRMRADPQSPRAATMCGLISGVSAFLGLSLILGNGFVCFIIFFSTYCYFSSKYCEGLNYLTMFPVVGGFLVTAYLGFMYQRDVDFYGHYDEVVYITGMSQNEIETMNARLIDVTENMYFDTKNIYKILSTPPNTALDVSDHSLVFAHGRTHAKCTVRDGLITHDQNHNALPVRYQLAFNSLCARHFALSAEQ